MIGASDVLEAHLNLITNRIIVNHMEWHSPINRPFKNNNYFFLVVVPFLFLSFHRRQEKQFFERRNEEKRWFS